jgi:hypothetical protein
MFYVLAHIKLMVAFVEYVLLLCLHMADPLYKIEILNGIVLLFLLTHGRSIILRLEVTCELKCAI